MGTRSLTHVKSDVWDEDETPKTLVTIYRQMDGYPSGLGEEMAEFLRGRIVVNGFGGGTPEKASNGMGCLAASLVGALKDGIGSVYLYPPDSKDCGEEYVYTISMDGARGAGTLNFKVEIVEGGYGKKRRNLVTLFDGRPEDFDAAVAEAARPE